MRACVLSPFSQFDSWRPYGPWSTRLLCPWDSPGENTGVGCCAVLQGIFWTQRWNPPLLSPSLAGRFFTTSAAWRAPCLNCMCIKTHEMCNIKSEWRTSLVVQWLRIHSQCRGCRFDPLSRRDQLSLCATNPEPAHLEPRLWNKRSHHNEKPVYYCKAE